MITPTDNTIKILEDAKRLLKTEGWTKGNYHNNEGYCLVGAIYQVPKFGVVGNGKVSVFEGKFAESAVQHQIIRELGPSRAQSLVMFNDVAKNRRQVTSLLGRTIKSLKREARRAK